MPTERDDKYHEDLFFIQCCCLRFAEHAFFFAVILQSRVAMAEEGLLLQQEKAISKPKRLSCIPKVDALWFCYSPVYQMTEYYRDGTFDNCRSKWTELFDCISLKAKPADQVQAILEERERKKPHIWEFRTPEEASKHWKEEFSHLQD